MRVRAAAAAALAAALLAACAGCIPERPWPDAARDPAAAAQAGIDSLRAAGRWAEALARARELERVGASLPGTPRWRKADLARERAMLAAVAALPDSARRVLATAERSLLDGRRLLDHDSVAAAEPCLARAWQARARWLGPRDVATIEAGLSLARAAFLSGHIERSDSLAWAAAAELPARVGATHPLTATAEYLVGLHIKNFGAAEQRLTAIPHFDRAVRVFAATLGPDSPEEADAYAGVANLLRLDSRTPPGVAIAMFRQLLAARRAAPGVPGEGVASALTGLGVLLEQEERWPEAERALREAIGIRRALPGGTRSPGYDLSLTSHGLTLRRLGRLDEAIAELRQAAALRESLWTMADRDEGRSIMLNLMPYRELAAALAARGRPVEAFEAFERANGRLLAERLMVGALQGADPWRGLCARVQRQLPADAALVVWIRNPMRMLRGDSPMWACVLRSTGPPRWHALPIRLDEGARTSHERFALSLRAAAGWPVRGASTDVTARESRRMGLEWFAPLEGDLAGVHEIVVAQSEMFGGVPLEAMRSSDGRWLADRYRISYVPSALLWVHGREHPRPRRGLTDRPALIVGAPSGAGPDASLPPLAAALPEIVTIASRFPHATVLAGAQASADRLRAMAASGELARYGLLHVAAHSEIEAQRPMRSALVLAGNGTADPERSRLRASEIAARWHLDADLVCLAACWSQAGFATPTDGSFGLEQAFLDAGARSLLVSLWPVDDEATALFMGRFYGDLTRRGAPMSRLEALQESRAWLRDWRAADGTRPWAHPCYWAAFVLIGEAG